ACRRTSRLLVVRQAHHGRERIGISNAPGERLALPLYPDTILHWIDDGEVASVGGQTFEKRSPIDDRVVASVTRGSAADATRAVRTERSPVGVCAAIMPFNSPLAGVAWKAFPALVCGNAVVAKSHELTPQTAVAFGRLLREAGLPRGVYSVVQGMGAEVGTPLVEDSRVGLVSFTGSVPTGKLIQRTVSGRPVLAK